MIIKEVKSNGWIVKVVFQTNIPVREYMLKELEEVVTRWENFKDGDIYYDEAYNKYLVLTSYEKNNISLVACL